MVPSMIDSKSVKIIWFAVGVRRASIGGRPGLIANTATWFGHMQYQPQCARGQKICKPAPDYLQKKERQNKKEKQQGNIVHHVSCTILTKYIHPSAQNLAYYYVHTHEVLFTTTIYVEAGQPLNLHGRLLDDYIEVVLYSRQKRGDHLLILILVLYNPTSLKTPPSPHRLHDLQDTLLNWCISFHSCQILSPSKTSVIVSAHGLTNITLLTLIATL